MKENAPEKIYLQPSVIEQLPYQNIVYTKRLADNSIEYTRTDAFIEKACEWIREFNNHYYIVRYSDSCEPPLSGLTEWFKNYMKEE